ncbi:MAG: hypothetical protein ACLFTL_03550, partial [Alphaproteobacteria bacterium]
QHFARLFFPKCLRSSFWRRQGLAIPQGGLQRPLHIAASVVNNAVDSGYAVFFCTTVPLRPHVQPQTPL